jgi:hypothetical protein
MSVIGGKADIAKLEKLDDDERALMATIAKTWLARGEDPSVVAGHVKAWIAKNDADCGGRGSEPLEDHRDPTQELEDQVNAHMVTHGTKRTVAYSKVLAASMRHLAGSAMRSCAKPRTDRICRRPVQRRKRCGYKTRCVCGERQKSLW